MDQSIKRSLSGMGILATGEAGAKLIGLASLPVITRLYTPADVGLLSLFNASVMLAGPLLTLQYERALPLPKKASTAVNILALALLLAVGLSFVAAGILVSIGTEIFEVFSMDALSQFWWVLPIGAGVNAVYRIMQLWATRERRYRAMSSAALQQSVAGNGTKIVLGLVMTSPLGLLLGQIIALGGGAIHLLLYFSGDVRVLLRHVSLGRLRVVAIRYTSFPLFRLPSQLTLMMATYAPVLFIGANYDAAVAGQFGLAMMALSLPVNLVARTLSKAYYGEIANLGVRAGAQIRVSVFSIVKLFGLLGVVFSLAVYFLAPLVFPLVFGHEWSIAGRFAALLSIYLAFQFVAVPVMNVLSIFNREDVYLQLNIQRLILVATVFGVAVFAELSIEQTLFGYSMVMALHYIFSVYKVLDCFPMAHAQERP